MTIPQFVKLAIHEDIKKGDHSALACVPATAKGGALLLVKEEGIIAGIDIAKQIFEEFDKSFEFEQYLNDGDNVKKGEIAFKVYGSSQTLLGTERLVLNVMQRMSAIATLTHKYVKAIEGLPTKVLDTRKTTPLIRFLEKEAVKIGGGHNHRMGLYDMIMIKDNHIDFCGGLSQALEKTEVYIRKNALEIPVIVEVRNGDEIDQLMRFSWVKRILLDNMSPEILTENIKKINGKFETEASGNISAQNLVSYAETGVDYVSMGALTYATVTIDLSLKAV